MRPCSCCCYVWERRWVFLTKIFIQMIFYSKNATRTNLKEREETRAKKEIKCRSISITYFSFYTLISVWPDVGVKRLPNCFHKLPKVSSAVFTLIGLFQNSPKSQQSFWATFVSEFIAKNFLKSPNLVTLLLSHKCFGYVHAHAWMGR